MARLMIYGSGYAKPYANDGVEAGSATAGTWFPSSVDFQATAMKSGVASGASSLADLINIIAGQPAGSISLLGLIGHAADTKEQIREGWANRFVCLPYRRR